MVLRTTVTSLCEQPNENEAESESDASQKAIFGPCRSAYKRQVKKLFGASVHAADQIITSIHADTYFGDLFSLSPIHPFS